MNPDICNIKFSMSEAEKKHDVCLIPTSPAGFVEGGREGGVKHVRGRKSE